jgi:hypothetical protein
VAKDIILFVCPEMWKATCEGDVHKECHHTGTTAAHTLCMSLKECSCCSCWKLFCTCTCVRACVPVLYMCLCAVGTLLDKQATCCVACKRDATKQGIQTMICESSYFAQQHEDALVQQSDDNPAEAAKCGRVQCEMDACQHATGGLHVAVARSTLRSRAAHVHVDVEVRGSLPGDGLLGAVNGAVPHDGWLVGVAPCEELRQDEGAVECTGSCSSIPERRQLVLCSE